MVCSVIVLFSGGVPLSAIGGSSQARKAAPHGLFGSFFAGVPLQM